MQVRVLDRQQCCGEYILHLATNKRVGLPSRKRLCWTYLMFFERSWAVSTESLFAGVVGEAGLSSVSGGGSAMAGRNALDAGESCFLRLNGVSWSIPVTWHCASCRSSSSRPMTCARVGEEYMCMPHSLANPSSKALVQNKHVPPQAHKHSLCIFWHTSVMVGRLVARDLTHSSASSTNSLQERRT